MIPEYEEDFNPCPFYGVAHLAQQDQHSQRARAFLRGAFDVAIEAGAEDLVSDRTFRALSRAIGALGDQSFSDVLYSALEFAADSKQDFELNVAASEIAVQLVALEYPGPLNALEEFCGYLCQTYAGEEFALRAHYALWLLKEDAKGAQAYLENSTQVRSLGLAATACADLDHKAALPCLEKRLVCGSEE